MKSIVSTIGRKTMFCRSKDNVPRTKNDIEVTQVSCICGAITSKDKVMKVQKIDLQGLFKQDLVQKVPQKLLKRPFLVTLEFHYIIASQ